MSCILGVYGKLGFGFTVDEKWGNEGFKNPFKNHFFMITNFSPIKVDIPMAHLNSSNHVISFIRVFTDKY